MRTLRLRHLLLSGGTLALLASPSLSLGQDGQPAVGPPVTAPETNKDAAGNPAESIRPPRAGSSDEVLPAVPESASDPAPFGTRGVRVDRPVRGAGPVADPAAPRPAGPAGRRAAANIFYAEGVVTRMSAAGKDQPNVRLVLSLDTSRDWESYAGGNESLEDPPAAAVPARDADAAANRAEAAAARAEKAAGGAPASDPPPALDPAGAKTDAQGEHIVPLMITRRTHIFTFARTPEGIDRYNAPTMSSPDHQTSATGLTRRDVPQTKGPEETNFTNIREGSYVAVRYRRAGNSNEALNLSLIELPLDTPATPRSAAGSRSATPGGPDAVDAPGLRPGTAAGRPAGGRLTDSNNPATGIPEAVGTGTRDPLRIPRVPTDTGGNAGTLPR